MRIHPHYSEKTHNIKASPTKEFFISMLTRDISTDRAILDLIDNSIDAATQSEKHNATIKLNASFENRVGNVLPEATGQGRAQPGGAHP